MQSKRKSGKVLLAIVIVILVFLGSFILTAWYYDLFKTGKSLPELGLNPLDIGTPKMKISLFFPDNELKSLMPVEREIPKSVHQSAMIRAVVEELIRGPYGSQPGIIPADTSLLGIFIDPAGICYLDFNAKISPFPTCGLVMETMILRSLLETLFYNFPEIKGVQILIEGQEKETLAGHIDISKPFLRETAL